MIKDCPCSKDEQRVKDIAEQSSRIGDQVTRMIVDMGICPDMIIRVTGSITHTICQNLKDAGISLDAHTLVTHEIQLAEQEQKKRMN